MVAVGIAAVARAVAVGSIVVVVAAVVVAIVAAGGNKYEVADAA